MVYSPRLRAAIGQVRSALENAGIGVQSGRFAQHGRHTPDRDAPLVLVACSGGRDSMALAALARTVCASLGVRAGAVIVDHRLQKGSGAAARQAAKGCTGLGLSPVALLEVDVPVQGRSEEASARTERYAALESCARWFGARAVLLAHTMDDQAETVLIDLMRSGGVGALAGMPSAAKRGEVTFLRPILGLTRAQTTGICKDLGLAWWDDPTNGDAVPATDLLPRSYPLRSRVRHSLVPAMNRFFGGDVSRHLARGAKVASLDEDYLEQQADKAYSRVVLGSGDGCVRIDAPALAGVHPAIASRVVLQVFADLGLACNISQVQAVLELAANWHGQGPLSLSSGYSVNRKKHVILVCKNRVHANR